MSYHRILTVVNEHTASTVAARYAIALAAACRAELVLYAAHDKGCNEVLLRRTEEHLEHMAAVAEKCDIFVTRIVEIGNIRSLLPKRSQAENVDLVVYPLASLERYGDNLKRHTVDYLLRTVTSDLAIMRIIAMVKPHPNHILVPLGKRGALRDTAWLLLQRWRSAFTRRSHCSISPQSAG